MTSFILKNNGLEYQQAGKWSCRKWHRSIIMKKKRPSKSTVVNAQISVKGACNGLSASTFYVLFVVIFLIGARSNIAHPILVL